MACFIIPTIVGFALYMQKNKLPKNLHFDWLIVMIFGGAAGLTVEHIAHGEIVPWPPFLTAMGSAAETAVMLEEMLAVGLPMTLVLICAWIAIVYLHKHDYFSKRFLLSISN
ncbi:MAG: hypothetical protein QW275_02355 [Candidatus Anstonellaceae archaeon]